MRTDERGDDRRINIRLADRADGDLESALRAHRQLAATTRRELKKHAYYLSRRERQFAKSLRAQRRRRLRGLAAYRQFMRSLG